MARISKGRQVELRGDAGIVTCIYEMACSKWGKGAVDSDLTRLWDLRCFLGMHSQPPFGTTGFKNLGEILPFGTAEFKNLDELLWIAKEVCGLGNRETEGG